MRFFTNEYLNADAIIINTFDQGHPKCKFCKFEFEYVLLSWSIFIIIFKLFNVYSNTVWTLYNYKKFEYNNGNTVL